MKKSYPVPDTDAADRISELMDEYGDILLRTCLFYLRDMYLAQDAVQDTFIKAYRSYGKLRNSASVRFWITRIAVNICRDMLRKRKKEIIKDELSLETLPRRDDLNNELDKVCISETVLALPIKYREVILLYYYHEMTLREIADVAGSPISTIASRLDRARRMLKAALKGWSFDE